MTLKPLADRLVVKPLSKDEVSTGGIIIPDTGKERPEQGTVVAIGPGKLKDDGSRHPMSVAVGQTVMFKTYAPEKVKLGDEELFVLSESDILAIIEA